METNDNLTCEELTSKLRSNIDLLMHGSSIEFGKAKKEITKLINHNRENFRKVAPLVFDYIKKFDSIEKWQNQVAFISGADLFFLSLADDHFPELKEFTIKAIQNPNGSVRKAIEHTSNWLCISLSDRIKPFRYGKFRESRKKIDDAETAKKQLLDFVREVEILIEKYEDEDDESEYVHEMKPSVCKSLHSLWDCFTRKGVYRELLEKTNPVSSEIFFIRKEIELEIEDLLKRCGGYDDLNDVKNAIYNESSMEDFHSILRIFDTGHKNAPEIYEYLEVVNDAWNYFPHRCLNGRCPAEMTPNML